MPAGIDTRHQRTCRSREGGRCNCTPTHQAHVFDARTGRRIRKTFPTKTAAKLWRSDALVALRQGRIAAQPSRASVSTALDALTAGMRTGVVLDRSGKSYKPSVIRRYEQSARLYLKPHIGRVRLDVLRRSDVQAMVDAMRKTGSAPASIQNALDPLRVLIRRAMRADELAVNPLDGLDVPARDGRRDRVETPDRAAKLIAAAPKGDRAFWAGAFYAGLRSGELRALRWRDVDFEAGVIRVERSWDDDQGAVAPKSKAGQRTVPMAGVLRRELAAHKLLTRSSGPDDLVLQGKTKGKPPKRETLRYRALEAWKDAKLEPLTPHEARHCAASYFIAAGMNAKQLSVYIGHSSVKTTYDVYGHLLPGDEAEAGNKLDAFLGGESVAAG